MEVIRDGLLHAAQLLRRLVAIAVQEMIDDDLLPLVLAAVSDFFHRFRHRHLVE